MPSGAHMLFGNSREKGCPDAASRQKAGVSAREAFTLNRGGDAEEARMTEPCKEGDIARGVRSVRWRAWRTSGRRQKSTLAVDSVIPKGRKQETSAICPRCTASNQAAEGKRRLLAWPRSLKSGSSTEGAPTLRAPGSAAKFAASNQVSPIKRII